MSNTENYSIKAGKFSYDITTKKVRVCKDKGKIVIYTNEQSQTYFTWINLDQNIEQLSIIVFPFDAVFQKIQNQNNTYLLRFQSNQDKYFFYLQEKINPQEFVKTVNQKIAFVPSEPSMEIQSSSAQVQANKIEEVIVPQPVQKVQKTRNQGQGLFDIDFIRRLQQNLTAAKVNQNDITHLSKILNPQVINVFLSQLTPEQKIQFLEHLPEQQRDAKFLASNIRSPQFQQAVDALTDALNSQNAIPLFMQLGLDQKHLKRHYGVHAFLKAFDQWSKKQQQNKQN